MGSIAESLIILTPTTSLSYWYQLQKIDQESMKHELQPCKGKRIERILDWRRANHKPLRLWDGGIGVAQLSDKEVHVIAHGWKFIQRDQRKPSRLRDGQGMD